MRGEEGGGEGWAWRREGRDGGSVGVDAVPSYVTVVLKWRDVWGLRGCVTYCIAELGRSAMLRPVSRTDEEEWGMRGAVTAMMTQQF